MKLSAFRTAPQTEFKAERELQEAGISAFVPVEYRWRRVGASRSRRIKIRTPMVPGYVIAASGLPMARYVRTRVGALTTDEADRLHMISGKEEANPDTPPPLELWDPGDKAVICEGPFKGHSVEVTESRGKVCICKGLAFRVAIHISQLQRMPPRTT